MHNQILFQTSSITQYGSDDDDDDKFVMKMCSVLCRKQKEGSFSYVQPLL